VIKDNKFGAIFAHIHQFDASVHLTSLNSPSALQQLEQSNKDIEDIISLVDDNTTVIVTSDHGMSINGHGGFSEEEELGVFFSYRKGGFLGSEGGQELPIKKVYRQNDICNIISYHMGFTSPIASYGDFPVENLIKETKNVLQ